MGTIVFILAMIVCVLLIQLYINHDQRKRLEDLERWKKSIRYLRKPE